MNRGGGRGTAGRMFPKDALSALSIAGAKELLTSGPNTLPPPLFPPLVKRPTSTAITPDMEYLLVLRQDFIDRMQLSSSYLRLPPQAKESKHEIDKLLSKLPPPVKEHIDWQMFPVELRPREHSSGSVGIASKLKPTTVKIEQDVAARLNPLEIIESAANSAQNNTTDGDVTAKKNSKNNDDDDDHERKSEDDNDEMDEEMDEGTDYINNYFDNGENYEDEDDNLDDGPIY